MKTSDMTFFRIFFVIAALWNLTGAIYGYFNTSYTFHALFNRELSDQLYYAIYQGAWGTTLVYFVGYLIVARNPVKHTGIVVVGGIGKIGYAISLLKLYFAGLAQPIALVIVVGDLVFFLLFLYYFFKLYKAGEDIL